MTVIANDYVPIVPYTTSVITLGVGQRSDVLVRASGDADDAIWMRSVLDKSCWPGSINQATALAAVYYSEADTTKRPVTNGTSFASGQCSNVCTLIRVWAISDETPGSATERVYLRTRLQECPDAFTCFRALVVW